MHRIGILGGSFNPPHLGHLWIAEECRQRWLWDEVWLIPAARPPHKPMQKMAGDRHRLAMLRRLARGMPGYRVLDLELRRGGTSYTVDTLRELTRRHPDTKFYFIVGSDALTQFGDWHCFPEICRRAQLVVVPRPEWPPRTLAAAKRYVPPALWPRFRKHVTPIPMLQLSSSDIRARLRRKREVAHLTGAAVAAYIRRHRIYA